MIENITEEKILVTGGTGFLGRYIVRELIAKDIKPLVLTRNAKTNAFGNQTEKISFVEVDLLDYASVKKIVEKHQPDRIIHLAGIVRPPSDQPELLELLNYEATARLLDIAATTPIKKIIIIGSADEYGFQSCPQIETMPAQPVSDYAISKNKAIEYALSSNRARGLPVVILRPFTVYGTGQPAKMFVSQAVACAVRGIEFEMSEGVQKRDLLFVTDFVNAIIKLLTANETDGEIFNVGSGKSIALRELANKIWEIAGADKNLLKIGARSASPVELHDTEADISKISRVIDWKPLVSIEEGLKITVANALKNLK
jgi:nucleoside-diphosphate-sugar epimerase